MLGICHGATPLSLFPICLLAPWQPSIRHRRHGDGAPRGAFIRPAGALRGLPANRAALTSPTPRQRQGTCTVRTHTLAWPPKPPWMNTRGTQHQSEGQPQDVGKDQPHRNSHGSPPQQQHTAQTDVLPLPHLLNVSMLWKSLSSNHGLQSNSLFCVA